MNTNRLAKENSVLLIGGILLAGGLGYGIYRAIKAFADFNKDTPFEGTGIVGTAGHVADAVLGGAPSAVGGAIGRTLFDWTHPVDHDADIFYKATIVGSPLPRIPDGLLLTAISIRGDELDGGNYVTKHGVRFRIRRDASNQLFAERA